MKLEINQVVDVLKKKLDMELEPLRLIAELIEVCFGKSPKFEKKPGCPDRFIWHGQIYNVVQKIAEWHDYKRRGRMAHNMRPEHLAAAKKRGSWGVGRDYFRVRTDTGQIFDLYYDRVPKKTTNRKGSWTLLREMSEEVEID